MTEKRIKLLKMCQIYLFDQKVINKCTSPGLSEVKKGRNKKFNFFNWSINPSNISEKLPLNDEIMANTLTLSNIFKDEKKYNKIILIFF